MLLIHDDVLGDLDVDDGIAYVTEVVQLPLPEVRAVVDPRTDADGTYDQTRHIGGRAVVATVVAFADATHSVEDRVDALRRFLHPSRRPTLSWTPVGSTVQRRMVVRSDSHDLAISDPRYCRGSVSWVCPSGLIESATLHSLIVPPSTTVGELGRTYNLTYNRTYPASSGGGSGVIAENTGSGPATWVARIYGPCTDPELTNVTLGQTIELAPLTIAAGHYVELNSAAHTALLDGDPNLSVYGSVTLASVWWPLAPGDNVLTFSPATAEPGVQAIIEWRDTWL